MQEKKIKHLSALTGIDINTFDVKMKDFDKCQAHFCATCPKQCDYKNIHLYGLYESVRWDGKYIYYCPLDFIFVAVPIADEYNTPNAGIILGPIIMGEAEDFDNTYDLPNMDTARVNDLAEVASFLLSERTDVASKESVTDFLNAIYKELELLPKTKGYPIELEKKLQAAIFDGDEKNAKEYLNRLLGEIFFRSNCDFAIIKARALELVILLSRSAIEGGADMEEIFALNNNYFEEINRFDTSERLAVWLSGIINRFVSYVFEFRDVRHSVTLRKVIRYIKNNYMNKITLDEIADHVYMSKSYISRLFNEGVGMSISAYINKTRVEKSKGLLKNTDLSIAEIANLMGFEDQSYFAKQFKSEIGISPKEFREKALV